MPNRPILYNYSKFAKFPNHLPPPLSLAPLNFCREGLRYRA